MGIHPEGNNLFNIFFKQMAVACSIFTLGGWVQLFWTVFDPMFTVVTIKSCIMMAQIRFLGISKNNQASECQV